MFPAHRWLTRLAIACALASASPGLLACGGGPDASPVGVVSHFLEAMDRSSVDDQALEEAYALLDQGAQHALTLRAQQAALLGGHTFQPWLMLARGRFRLRFAPAEHGGMRARVNGDRAIVSVASDDGSAKADVPVVRESGQWRVQLAIPPLTHVETGSAVGSGSAPTLP
ncbi:MAG TPA: hypothetical protein VF331_19025 [Polyangiales bacterium]